MHDVLKTYAKKRQAEAPSSFDIHPATRKLLQGEVSRQFATKREDISVKPRWTTLLFPRIAFAAAILIAFLGILFLFESKKHPGEQMTVASQSKQLEERTDGRFEAPATETAPTPARQIAQTSEPKVGTFKESEAAATASTPATTAATDSVALSEPAPISEPEQPPADLAKRDELKEGDKVAVSTGATANLNDFFLSTQPASTGKLEGYFATTTNHYEYDSNQPKPAAAPVIVARESFKKAPAAPHEELLFARAKDASVGSSTTLNFVQQNDRAAYRQNLQSPPQPDVLNNFQITISGDKLQVVDRDGSIYNGDIVNSGSFSWYEDSRTAGEAKASKGGEELAKRKQAPAKQAAQPLQFRAAGTNRQLNELVTLNGVLFTNSVTSVDKAEYATRTRSATPVLKTSKVPVGSAKFQTQPALSNVFMEGEAIIGGTNQFEIRAIQTK